MRILVIGASGSGTSTLAKALAISLNSHHVDADDYYWLPTSPPFTSKRDSEERLSAITKILSSLSDAVVAGSILEWGEALENSFDFIVFLYLPENIRMSRIKERELARYGKEVDAKFLSWAGQYDEGVRSGRSLARHQDWLAKRNCPILRLDGDISVEERVRLVRTALLDHGLLTTSGPSI
ncbi:hypothetical protein DXT88_20350 [Herbaspirillum lusitanum]|uniref:AAA family ATPase n=1 Tax=Herbaspirillum lusitanum TaxID=213312 RepID=UPI002238E5A7|nr:AAA family ATPase [Herbaspirillum lusitanum]MCW5300526.1 hypothetical protein [Herbaspirillum lusitanum]